MGDHDSTAFGAVELPRPRVLPSRDRRRHRALTGTSGLLLFVCMFLPAVEGCDRPLVPLDAPAFWAPYLYGLVFAFAALARTRRGLVGALYALRALSLIVIAAGFGIAIAAGPSGVFLVLYGMILLATTGWSGVSERRVAATAVTIAATSSVWFALWSCMPAALLGLKLSLASALGLLAGSLVWIGETRRSCRIARLPSAILRDS
jgi:hypothetical protein